MQNHLISIILPIHKQSDHIQNLVDQFEAELSKLPVAHELLLVVNGDDKKSLKACQEVAQNHKSIRVLFSEKSGWGLAVQLGLKEAKGDILCYTNSARTTPKDLLLFCVYAIANPEVVLKATRTIRDSVIRALGSLLYNMECRALFDLNNWDVNGTPKVFPRKFDRLTNLSKENDLIDLEFSLVCKTQNYPMLEIPILSSRRHGGYSTTKIPSAFRMYSGAFQMWRAHRKDLTK